MRYNELTIFTDLDGTLLVPDTFEITDKNLSAIRSFLADGGRFAVATGRPLKWVYPIAQRIGVNFPCILCNGGEIFDFEKGVHISKKYLPEAAYGYARQIADAMPWAGVVPICDEPHFDLKHEDRMVDYINKGKPPYQTPNWRENREPWFKVLFGVPPTRAEELLAFARKAHLPGVRIVTTIDYLVEMIPEGVSKGSVIEDMYATLGLAREKTVAIGDYYNDLEMIHAAGIGACVQGSPDELVAASKYVTCRSEDGAVADLIERLKMDYP